jgi:hypothetical protein
MARTQIGVMASPSPSSSIVNRSASGGAINSEESLIATGSGVSGWNYGANRGHYLFLDEAWTVANNDTKNAISGTATADFENDRLPVITHKPASNNASDWVNIANGNFDAQITARGNEIITYQNAHRGLGKWGATFVWSFHHEPNSSTDITNGGGGSVATAAANWRAATQHIYDMWVAQGVSIWDGEADWTTHTEGLVLSVNLVDGGSGGVTGAHKGIWWGPVNGNGAGDAWMDANCKMYATDPYALGPSFTPFSFQINTTQGGTVSIKTWSDAKKAYQESQGRTFLQGIFETGVGIYPSSQYPNGPHSTWTATGRTANEAEWIDEMHDWIRDNWPTLNLVCYWDDFSSLTTHNYYLDNNTAKWNAVIAAWTDSAVFASSLDALPTAGGGGSTSKVLIID